MTEERLMRRLRAATVVAAAAVCLLAASAPGAQAAPNLVLEQNCTKDAAGTTIYGVNISVSGLAPNASFVGQLTYTYIDPPPGSVGGGVGPATFTADSNGTFKVGFGTVGIKTVFTATVVYQGQTLTQTLRVTCEPRRPTTMDECKHGGWATFGVFKNQGECISSVMASARRKCVFERAAQGLLTFREKYGLGPNHDYAMRRCVRLYTGF
jgi:hypothetical protein